MPEQNIEEPFCGYKWCGPSFYFINFINNYVRLSNVLLLLALFAVCLRSMVLFNYENESS
ncbi:hypothetical protein AT246_05405 [Bartonella henselae]|nr:hypothetical protein BhenCHDE101_05530 [Bartonella henselae]PNM38698.1 hypothetical protein AL470_004780 [Bartonella henselae str. Houston-1]OLL38549.1 hypothetical protein AT237_02210 [Bartonella henselae]OLL41940.1 hypothetical protein AT244_03955 [Bartonella henselae]OLL45520.1 hypothetical protein AT242_00100 [Bartonella henselae]